MVKNIDIAKHLKGFLYYVGNNMCSPGFTNIKSKVVQSISL